MERGQSLNCHDAQTEHCDLYIKFHTVNQFLNNPEMAPIFIYSFWPGAKCTNIAGNLTFYADLKSLNRTVLHCVPKKNWTIKLMAVTLSNLN